MSKVIAIAKREIEERAFVFVVAAALTAAPFLALLMPSGTFDQRLEAAKILGIILAAAFIIGLGALLGASIVGRESREKRLSFYFTRPVSGSSIWYGKMIAALALLAGCAVILFAPGAGMAASGWRGLWTLSLPWLVAIALAISLVVFLFVHAASTMLRSGSMLIALDFIASIVFVFGVTGFLGPTAIHNAPKLLVALAVPVIAVVVLTLFFAGAWQLSRGRIDVRASHRQISLFIWSMLGGLVIVLAVVTAWIESAGVDDLKMQYAEEMSDGSAALVGGVAKHRLDYAVCVLADTDSGRVIRVSPFARWRLAMSRSGRRAAWLQPYPSAILRESLSAGRPNRILDYRLVSVSLADGKFENASIEVKGYPVGLELSADGSRVAVMAGEIVTVFDLASGRNLGSARIPSELGVWSAALTFVTPDVIRVYTRENTRGKANTRGTFLRLGAYEFALRQRTLKCLLDVERLGNWQDLDVSSPNGTRLLQRVIRSGPPVEGSSVTLIMYDLTSGKPLFEIDSSASERIRSSWLLSDGRVAAIATRGQRTIAQLYDGSGTRVRELDLGRTTPIRIIDEVAPGVLAVAQAAPAGSSYRRGAGWTLTRVDLNNATTAPIASGLAPLPRDLYKARLSPAVPGPIVHPMWDEAGHLVAVDLRTGARKKLIDA